MYETNDKKPETVEVPEITSAQDSEPLPFDNSDTVSPAIVNPSEQPSVPGAAPAQDDAPVSPNSSHAIVDQFSKASKKSHKQRWLIALLVIIVLATIGLFYDHEHTSSTVNGVKTISHLSIGIQDTDIGQQLYPNSEDEDGAILFNSQIFEGLVRYVNQDQTVPDLATGWTTPNAITWLFNINTNVKFHDGHTLTPEAVKYSLDLMLNSNSTYAQTFNGNIKSVSVLNNHQIKITTAQPNPTLLNQLSFLYIIDPNLPKGENASMAGTGPYELKPGTKYNKSHDDLVAFDDYHDGPILTKEVTVSTNPNVASLTAGLKNHTYDIVGDIPTKDADLQGTYKFLEEDDTVYFLSLNTETGPLSNKLVREAIRYAINPKAIDASVGESNTTSISQLIPPSITGYNPSIKPYSQDIAKAKQLLAQAGYPNGLTLSLETGFTGDEVASPETIAKELGKAGITVNIKYETDGDTFINDWETGNEQILQIGYSSDTLDGVDIFQSSLPTADYDNPTLDSVLKQASTTIDPTKRISLLQQAGSIVDSDIAVVPLSYQNNIWLMDKSYVLHQDLPSDYISVYFYKIHE